MKKKKQSTFLNVLMIIAIAAIVFSGIMIAGNIRKSDAVKADSSPEPTLKISDVSEVSNETRMIVEESGITLDDYISVNVTDDNTESYITGNAVTSPAASSAPRCTLEIVCGTVLSNLDNLREGKEAFVPPNGIILAASTIEFEAGDTVFNVLQKACALADIQLEYSWTPLYDSYYIEGINNLYEFDCGEQSGWMYKVNGVFPDYGCSEYKLADGDTIVFCYTCAGLGADVGGSVY